MKKPNYIGFNPEKLREPSSVQSLHDTYKRIQFKYRYPRGIADVSQLDLPIFDKTSLVAWWPFIHDLKDYGPNGFDWTPSTTVKTTRSTPIFLPGQRGKALYLANQNWAIAHNAAWSWGTGNFTLMFWMHVNHQEQWGLAGLGSSSTLGSGLISKRTNDSDTGWEFYNNGSAAQSGHMNFRMQNIDLVSSGLVPSNQWTHYAVVRYGTGASLTYLYINGYLDATQTYTTNIASTSYLSLGRSIFYSQYNRGTSIKHFLAFSRALDQREILTFINRTGSDIPVPDEL